VDVGEAECNTAIRTNRRIAPAQMFPGNCVRFFCAKACVAHGGPIVFLGQDGAVYLALPHADGTAFSSAVLNDLGVAGVTVTGNAGESRGIHSLSVHLVGM